MLNFRTAALSAAAIIGLAVAAGAQAPAKTDSTHRGMHERGDRQGQVEKQRRGVRGERGMRGARGMRGGKGMRGARGQHGRRVRGDMMRELNLTDAQRTRIKAIHEKYQPQFRKLREDARAQQQRDQFRQRAETLRQQQQNEIRSVLTAEQRAKIDARRIEQAKRMEDRAKQMQERARQLRERRG